MPEYALALSTALFSETTICLLCCRGLDDKEKYNQEDVNYAHNWQGNSCICLVTYTLNFSTVKVVSVKTSSKALRNPQQSPAENFKRFSKSFIPLDTITHMIMGIQSQERKCVRNVTVGAYITQLPMAL